MGLGDIMGISIELIQLMLGLNPGKDTRCHFFARKHKRVCFHEVLYGIVLGYKVRPRDQTVILHIPVPYYFLCIYMSMNIYYLIRQKPFDMLPIIGTIYF